MKSTEKLWKPFLVVVCPLVKIHDAKQIETRLMK